MLAAVAAATGVMVAAVLVLGLGSGGCFSPKFESCAVSCGEASACPDDQFCLSDGKCHASQEDALCTPGGGDASVDDGDDTADDSDDTADDADDSDDTADDVTDVSDDTSDDTTDDLPPPDAGPPDAAPIDAGPPVTPTSPGDLVVTEIHRDPTEAQDPDGEWFEVHNPTGLTFQMQGLRIRDQDTDFFDVDESVIVPPGGRVVFARVAAEGSNGGVNGVDFAYGKLFTLANGEDEIVIQNLDNNAILDSVAYGFDFPDVEGASMSLDPDFENSTDNNDFENWCAGSTPYGQGDLGSPGSANPDC